MPPEITRHADHDPGLICRPAFGRGLCEVLRIKDGGGEKERPHEHEWTRCPDCKQPGQPCPCSRRG